MLSSSTTTATRLKMVQTTFSLNEVENNFARSDPSFVMSSSCICSPSLGGRRFRFASCAVRMQARLPEPFARLDIIAWPPMRLGRRAAVAYDARRQSRGHPYGSSICAPMRGFADVAPAPSIRRPSMALFGGIASMACKEPGRVFPYPVRGNSRRGYFGSSFPV